VAGILVLTAVSFAIEAIADPLLMKAFPEALPSRQAISHNLPASLFTLAYGALCVAAGGYTTAWVARRWPVRHALLMGAIQAALTVWAMSAMAGQAPTWVWTLSIAMAIPGAGFGGWLYARRTRRT
jgi:hypothetical protein